MYSQLSRQSRASGVCVPGRTHPAGWPAARCMVSFRGVVGTTNFKPLVVGAVLLLGLAALAWHRRGNSPEDRADAGSVSVAPSGLPGLPRDLSYVVEPGDTLGGIAAKHGTTVDALLTLNGLTDPDAVYPGQTLAMTAGPTTDGPEVRLVPDSEVVFGRAYVGFDAGSAIAPNSALAAYTELVDGAAMSGPRMVADVARDFSVGPRVLLAQIEAAGGWVTGPGNPEMSDYPLGLVDASRTGLWRQLNWFADHLNRGYYDWRTRDSRLMLTGDGVALAGHPELGPGPFAIQAALAAAGPASGLDDRMARFDRAYRALFGDPFAREILVVPPGEALFPILGLPWTAGEEWWFTGGPHGGWAEGSAWAAVDFVPPDEERGCYISERWVTAVADGVVVEAGTGALALDLDGDGLRQTGPVVFHLHVAAEDRVAPGRRVQTGDRLGHPSCEGGLSNATHLHLARLLDGEWLAAGGPAALRLGDWTFSGGSTSYEGSASANGERREPCECRDPRVNGIE